MVHVSQKLANIIHQVAVSEDSARLAPIACATQTIEGSYDTHPLYVDLIGIYLFFGTEGPPVANSRRATTDEACSHNKPVQTSA